MWKSSCSLNSFRNLVRLASETSCFGKLKSPLDTDIKANFKNEVYSKDTSTSKSYFKKNSPYWYLFNIIKLIDDNKIYEALSLYEDQMLVDGLPKLDLITYPLTQILQHLINGLAHRGDFEKTFYLYMKMKHYNLTIDPSIYTSLITACSQSKDKRALEKLDYIRGYMAENKIKYNRKTSNALIKAYGVNGEIIHSFALFQEMKYKGQFIGKDSYLQLLIASMSDKKSGFTIFLKVWREMLANGLTPSLFHYNALLRCVRDCRFSLENANNGEIGTQTDLEFEGPPLPPSLSVIDNNDFKERIKLSYRNLIHNEVRILNHVLEQNKPVKIDDSLPPKTYFGKDENFDWIKESAHIILSTGNEKCSELTKSPVFDFSHQSNAIDVEADLLTFCENLGLKNCLIEKHLLGLDERLARSLRYTYMGGTVGFFALLYHAKIRPDIKTLTLLAEITPLNPIYFKALLNTENFVFDSHCKDNSVKNYDLKTSKDSPRPPFLTKHLNPKLKTYVESLNQKYDRALIFDADFFLVVLKKYALAYSSYGRYWNENRKEIFIKDGSSTSTGDSVDIESVIQDILYEMQKRNLSLDIRHFGALALACRTLSQARKLLEDMKSHNLKPNIIIMDSLFKRACYSYNLHYMMFCLKLCSGNTPPDTSLQSSLPASEDTTKEVNAILLDDILKKRIDETIKIIDQALIMRANIMKFPNSTKYRDHTDSFKYDPVTFCYKQLFRSKFDGKSSSQPKNDPIGTKTKSNYSYDPEILFVGFKRKYEKMIRESLKFHKLKP